VTSHSNSSFKGYQNMLSYYLASMMTGSSMTGPIKVKVEPGKPAVDQLWNEFSGIIEAVNF
jgi:hypothetical protein